MCYCRATEVPHLHRYSPPPLLHSIPPPPLCHRDLPLPLFPQNPRRFVYSETILECFQRPQLYRNLPQFIAIFFWGRGYCNPPPHPPRGGFGPWAFLSDPRARQAHGLPLVGDPGQAHLTGRRAARPRECGRAVRCAAFGRRPCSALAGPRSRPPKTRGTGPLAGGGPAGEPDKRGWGVWDKGSKVHPGPHQCSSAPIPPGGGGGAARAGAKGRIRMAVHRRRRGGGYTRRNVTQGGTPPWPPPRRQDQSDHRGRKRLLPSGTCGAAVCGAQTFGSQTHPPHFYYCPARTPGPNRNQRRRVPGGHAAGARPGRPKVEARRGGGGGHGRRSGVRGCPAVAPAHRRAHVCRESGWGVEVKGKGMPRP